MTVLSEKGAPTPVAATRLRAPESLMGPVGADVLDAAVRQSPPHDRYAQAVDRESAYEKLTETGRGAKGPDEMTGAGRGAGGPDEMTAATRTGKRAGGEEKPSVVEQVIGSGMFQSLARSIGTRLGREVTRSLFGTARRRR